MIISILLLIVGFVLLIKGADIFVDGASSTALNLKVSKMVIGLTIVAFGTSAPEFAVSIKALLSGSSDIVLGNVVGSNIFNIGIVIGLPCALIGNINVGTFNYIDMFTMIGAAILLFLLTFKKRKLDKGEGLIMLLIFIVYYGYVIIGG